MKNEYLGLNTKRAILWVSNFMDTPYYAIFLALVSLLSYFLGLDLLNISIISISISFSLLFKKKLNCLLIIFLFMACMISKKHSPVAVIDNGDREFFYRPSNYIFCIVAASIPVVICIFKSAVNIKNGDFFSFKLLIVTFLFGLALLTNGLMNEAYNPLNLSFSLFMFFFFVFLFFGIYPQITLNRENIVQISKQVCFFVLTILVECLVFFCTNYEFENGIFMNFYLGWGNSNTIGMLLIIAIPFLCKMHNYENRAFKIFAIILTFFAIFLSALLLSAQTYLGLAVLAWLILFFNWVCKKRCRKSLIILACYTVLAASFCIIFFFVKPTSVQILVELSNGRIELWKRALLGFKKNIVFGSGFYFNGSDPNINLSSFVPFCVHNTILQMLGSCGLLGMISYGIYRITTIIESVKLLNSENYGIFISLLMILIMSLVDIHIFDFFGTAIYVVLLCMCLSRGKSEKVHFNADCNNLNKTI
ncbi:MAG: O-antigen ligase family protein [Bacilli bacterium]|nr:O-antigen ligase family protein [Bacilli bacterium]